MIIFDRFLCCVKLQFFGKIVGWTGTMLSLMTAYAIFLIASGRELAGQNASTEFLKDLLKDKNFNYYAFFSILLFIAIAVFHILLICGIKYLKSMLIVPYIILAVVVTATMVCLLPSAIQLTASKCDCQEATKPYLIVAGIFALIFVAYFTLCIYSLYQLINFDEKRRKLYKNADKILIAPLPI